MELSELVAEAHNHFAAKFSGFVPLSIAERIDI